MLNRVVRYLRQKKKGEREKHIGRAPISVQATRKEEILQIKYELGVVRSFFSLSMWLGAMDNGHTARKGQLRVY